MDIHGEQQQVMIMNTKLITTITIFSLLLITNIWADQWIKTGPSTLTITKTENTISGFDSQKINFSPILSNNNYWCNATYSFDTPKTESDIEITLRSSNIRNITIKVIASNNTAAYYNLTAPKTLSKVTLSKRSPDAFENGNSLKDIARIEFIFNNKQYSDNENIDLWVYDIKLLNIKSLNPEPKMYNNFWMPKTIPNAKKGYEIETCLWNTWVNNGSGWGAGDAEFTGYNDPKGQEVVKDVIDYLVKTYKNVAMDMPYIKDDYGIELIKYAKSKGVNVHAEAHNSPALEWLKSNKALAINKDNKNILDLNIADKTQGYDMTNPEVLKMVQNRFLDSAKIGIKYFRTVDYIWPPWNGEIWGYSDSAIKRWREDLISTDTGLKITEKDKKRTAYFPEYYKSYHGYFPDPKDLNISGWNEYYPPNNNNNSIEQSKLYTALYHYEWLKFINEAALPSYKQYGVMAQPICNPESRDNGTDLYWLSKLEAVAGYCAEWWGNYSIVIPNYYNGKYYQKIADDNKKELNLFGESSAAGGSPFLGKQGKPHYWDNQANYLITYSQESSVNFKSKQDQYWGSSIKKMSNPKDREYQSFTAFTSAYAGFLQAVNDGYKKPTNDLLGITQRSPAGYSGCFTNSTDGGKYGLNKYMSELNYLYDGTAFPQHLPLSNYNTILYTPQMTPLGYINELNKWLNAKERRTLITHSFIPLNTDQPNKPMDRIVLDDTIPEVQRDAITKLGFDKIKRGKVISGEIKIENSNYTALSKYDGKYITLNAPLYEIGDDYKPLVTISGIPLISEKKLSNGSNILYIHFEPLQDSGTSNANITQIDSLAQSAEFEAAVIDFVLKYSGYSPLGINKSTDDKISVLTYTNKNGQATLLFNRKANTKVEYGDEIFDSFQAQSPNAIYSDKTKVRAIKANKKFKITDMISNAETTAVSDSQGYIEIDMNGYNAKGIYIKEM